LRNLIPDFIAEKIRSLERSGSFRACTMFMDISGFTDMTERLMKEGKEGAEVLSEVINNVFDPVIKAVYRSGGFIATFAGDAFTVIYTDIEKPLKTADCALNIKKIFSDTGKQKTKFGEFELCVKIGISAGSVDYGIIRNNGREIYYFKGDAVDGCANSEHLCRSTEIIIDKEFLNSLPENTVETAVYDRSHYRLISCKKQTADSNKVKYPSVPQEIIKMFIPESVLALKAQGEFREIVPVFINLRNRSAGKNLGESVREIVRLCGDQGGYFNKIDFGDKGGVVLALFGAPVSYENNIKRALNFINSLRTFFHADFRAGISAGIAYAGFVGSSQRCEYTALGDYVNLASRMMTDAEWGGVLITESIARKIRSAFRTESMGNKIFKGKTVPEKIYMLCEPVKVQEEMFFKGEMIGRQTELKKLLKYAEPVFEGKSAGLTLIYGEPGIGKSRFLYEFKKRMESFSRIVYMRTDSILKLSLNPFKYYLNNYFRQNSSLSIKEKKKNFEDIYGDLLNSLQSIQDKRAKPLLKELKRIKSVLAAQIDVIYKRSLYEKLEPKERSENTIFACRDFFAALSLISPIIIVIEDIHWLDEDSHKVFQVICRSLKNYPIMIAATSRFNDDGTRPVIKADDNVIKHDIVIDKLIYNDASRFIENMLEGRSDNLLKDTVISRSDNSPFFIEQIILYLKENNLLVFENKKYKLLTHDLEIPGSISAVIIARIDRLEADIKNMVQIASVCGREVELKIFLSILKMCDPLTDTDTVQPSLDKIENEQLWTRLNELKYIFKHVLLHEAVYEMQLKSRLRELHFLAARSIEKIYESNKEKYYETALHYDKAGKYSEARFYYEKAGEYLSRNFDNQRALTCYDRLLTLPDQKSASRKIIYLLKKSDILMHTGKWKECEDIRSEALKEAVASSNEEMTAMAYSENGSILLRTGNYSKASECFSRSLEIYEKLNDENQTAYIIQQQAWMAVLKNDDDNALKLYEKALRIYESSGYEKGIAEIMEGIGIIQSNRGNSGEAMKFYHKSLEIEEKLGNKLDIALTYNNIGAEYLQMSDYGSAINCFEKYLKVSEDLGHKKGISIAVGNIGAAYTNMGKNDKAFTAYTKKLRIDEELNDRYGLAWVLSRLGRLYANTCDYTNALLYLHKALNIENALDNKLSAAGILKDIADVHKTLKEYDTSLENYNLSIGHLNEIDNKTLLVYVMLAKAGLLFLTGQNKSALPLTAEAKKLSLKLDDHQAVFEADVLSAKINSDLYEMENMLNKTENEIDKAVLQYELWKLSLILNNCEKAERYKMSALESYRIIYGNTPFYEYKVRINELEK